MRQEVHLRSRVAGKAAEIDRFACLEEKMVGNRRWIRARYQSVVEETNVHAEVNELVECRVPLRSSAPGAMHQHHRRPAQLDGLTGNQAVPVTQLDGDRLRGSVVIERRFIYAYDLVRAARGDKRGGNIHRPVGRTQSK